jgi:predicted Na+-dependent transporter
MKIGKLKSNLPAFLTISLCLLVQAGQLWLRMDAPRTYHLVVGDVSTDIVLNVGLLIMLPFIGATGAMAARRFGESPAAAVRSVLSPVAIVSAMLISLFMVDLATTRALFISLEYSCGIIVGWVIVPGVALLLGGVAGWNFPLARERARV